MNYKKKLILFVKLKNLYVNCDIDYITKKDIEEIDIWPERICKKIYKYIVDFIYTIDDTDKIIFNIKTCPWCLYDYYNFGYDSCIGCVYGKRHGICYKDDSDYKKFVNSGAFSSLSINVYIKILKYIEYMEH
jgi:hypothetical protein